VVAQLLFIVGQLEKGAKLIAEKADLEQDARRLQSDLSSYERAYRITENTLNAMSDDNSRLRKDNAYLSKFRPIELDPNEQHIQQSSKPRNILRLHKRKRPRKSNKKE
jgi:hypothetical protein